MLFRSRYDYHRSTPGTDGIYHSSSLQLFIASSVWIVILKIDTVLPRFECEHQIVQNDVRSVRNLVHVLPPLAQPGHLGKSLGELVVVDLDPVVEVDGYPLVGEWVDDLALPLLELGDLGEQAVALLHLPG